MSGWTTADIPPQGGKTAVITGATGGLGYETALALAGAGATVVLTGRSDAKGRAALEWIRAQYPKASISYETLDLASPSLPSPISPHALPPPTPRLICSSTTPA